MLRLAKRETRKRVSSGGRCKYNVAEDSDEDEEVLPGQPFRGLGYTLRAPFAPPPFLYRRPTGRGGKKIKSILYRHYGRRSAASGFSTLSTVLTFVLNLFRGPFVRLFLWIVFLLFYFFLYFFSYAREEDWFFIVI